MAVPFFPLKKFKNAIVKIVKTHSFISPAFGEIYFGASIKSGAVAVGSLKSRGGEKENGMYSVLEKSTPLELCRVRH